MNLRKISEEIKKKAMSKYIVNWERFINTRGEKENFGQELVEELRALDFDDNEIKKQVDIILQRVKNGALNQLRLKR